MKSCTRRSATTTSDGNLSANEDDRHPRPRTGRGLSASRRMIRAHDRIFEACEPFADETLAPDPNVIYRMPSRCHCSGSRKAPTAHRCNVELSRMVADVADQLREVADV